MFGVIVCKAICKNWNNRNGRAIFYHLSNSVLRGQKRERIWIFVSSTFWMKSNRCRALFELIHNASDGVLIKLFLGFVPKYRWEHRTTTHKEVDKPSDKIVIKEVGTYWKENASRQSCAIKVDPCDDKKIKEGSMV